MSTSKIVGAVEIGTAKITVLVGEVLEGQSLNIIGLGEAPSQGVQKGVVVDFKVASKLVHDALARAEKAAGASIDAVYISQSGSHLNGFFHTSTVNVSSSTGTVYDSDVERAVKEAKAKELPDDRVYLHHIHNGYTLDGRPVVEPVGMQGEKLSLSYWSIHGDIQQVRDNIHVINAFGLTVEEAIVSSLASGLMVTTDAEREHGVLVIDFGAGTTDYVLYQGGFVRASGSIPVGGDHITNDLSLGLRISQKQAESLKIEFGKARLESADEEEKVWLIGDKMIGDRHLPKAALVKIIEARAQELVGIIFQQLKRVYEPKSIPAGIIMTGGASLLPSLGNLVESTFHQEVKMGITPSWVREDLASPAYSTALGLLHFALTGQAMQVPRSSGRSRLWGRVAKIFN